MPELIRRALVSTAVLAALAGCGAAPEEQRALPHCRPAVEEAGLIAERVMGSLAEPQAVPLDPPVGQYVLLVAAQVQGEVGVWAVGPWLGGARILAVDAAARRHSEWGTAIADSSPAGKQRKELAGRREVEAVRACVPH